MLILNIIAILKNESYYKLQMLTYYKLQILRKFVKELSFNNITNFHLDFHSILQPNMQLGLSAINGGKTVKAKAGCMEEFRVAI
jgi:hypothetical protein